MLSVDGFRPHLPHSGPHPLQLPVLAKWCLVPLLSQRRGTKVLHVPETTDRNSLRVSHQCTPGSQLTHLQAYLSVQWHAYVYSRVGCPVVSSDSHRRLSPLGTANARAPCFSLLPHLIPGSIARTVSTHSLGLQRGNGTHVPLHDCRVHPCHMINQRCHSHPKGPCFGHNHHHHSTTITPSE
jgi:hypothetical protein